MVLVGWACSITCGSVSHKELGGTGETSEVNGYKCYCARDMMSYHVVVACPARCCNYFISSFQLIFCVSILRCSQNLFHTCLVAVLAACMLVTQLQCVLCDLMLHFIEWLEKR